MMKMMFTIRARSWRQVLNSTSCEWIRAAGGVSAPAERFSLLLSYPADDEGKGLQRGARLLLPLAVVTTSSATAPAAAAATAPAAALGRLEPRRRLLVRVLLQHVALALKRRHQGALGGLLLLVVKGARHGDRWRAPRSLGHGDCTRAREHATALRGDCTRARRARATRQQVHARAEAAHGRHLGARCEERSERHATLTGLTWRAAVKSG